MGAKAGNGILRQGRQIEGLQTKKGKGNPLEMKRVRGFLLDGARLHGFLCDARVVGSTYKYTT